MEEQDKMSRSNRNGGSRMTKSKMMGGGRGGEQGTEVEEVEPRRLSAPFPVRYMGLFPPPRSYCSPDKRPHRPWPQATFQP